MQFFTIDSYTFAKNPSQVQDTLTYQGADLQMLDGTWYAQPSSIPNQTTGYTRQITYTATLYQPMTRFTDAVFNVGSPAWDGLTYDATRHQLWAWVGPNTIQGATLTGIPLESTSYTGPSGGAFANVAATPSGTLIVGWSTGLVVEVDPTTGNALGSSTVFETIGATFAGFAGTPNNLWGLTTAGILYSGTLNGNGYSVYPPLQPYNIEDFSGLTMDSYGYLWSTRIQYAQAVCFAPSGRLIAGEELRDTGPYTWLPNGLALLYRPRLNQLQQVRLNSVDRDVDRLVTTLNSGKVTVTDEENVSRLVAVSQVQKVSSVKYLRGYDLTIQVNETI